MSEHLLYGGRRVGHEGREEVGQHVHRLQAQPDDGSATSVISLCLGVVVVMGVVLVMVLVMVVIVGCRDQCGKTAVAAVMYLLLLLL